ncbi:MAG: putative divalent cation resistant determinant protein C [Planctomycetota bacterium]|nr:MAG: putative divalent cation resistant determinant protein C [Planctomycetota bacterium]
MGGQHQLRRIVAGCVVAWLSLLAGASDTFAEWPKLWRGSSAKPKIATARSDSTRTTAAANQPLRPMANTTGPRTSRDRDAMTSRVVPASGEVTDTSAIYEQELSLPRVSRVRPIQQAHALSDDSPETEDNGITLDALVSLGLEQNPRLAKVSFAVEAARGRAHQAGLYPNPLVALTWDELGDKTGPSGVNTLPLVTQEIVMGRKLKLSRAAAEREVEQASWGVMAERYAMLAEIRAAYFDALALQQRVRLLDQVRQSGIESTEKVRSLKKVDELAEIDVLPVEAELLRYEAEWESAQAEKAAAYKRLAALLGVHRLAITKVAGHIEDYFLPDYDTETTPQYVLSVHPEIQQAQWGVEKAKLVVQRAKAEPIPNLSVNGGYVRQNQNRSDDYSLGVSASVPLWNRNQGNIRAAEAELCAAMQEVARTENALTDRVATALREFAAARKRAEKYQAVVNKAEQAQNIASKDERRNLSPLMVLELQRSLRQANLERLKSLGEAWKEVRRHDLRPDH